MKEKIKFKDLNIWLKIVVIFGWIKIIDILIALIFYIIYYIVEFFV